MTIKINRMTLRIPAGMAQNPEAFARSVSERLAQDMANAGPTRADTVRVRLPQSKGDAAPSVSRAIGRAIRHGGDS